MIGILINGQFQCIGTPQELKEKFGEGIGIKIDLEKSENAEYIKTLLKQSFP